MVPTVIVVVVVAVLVVLFTVPVDHSTSFAYGSVVPGGGISFFNDTTSEDLCPTGASVSISYSSSVASLSVALVAPNGSTVWSQDTLNGSTSFTVSSCGTYLIELSGTGAGSYSVSGTISYRGPIL